MQTQRLPNRAARASAAQLVDYVNADCSFLARFIAVKRRQKAMPRSSARKNRYNARYKFYSQLTNNYSKCIHLDLIAYSTN